MNTTIVFSCSWIVLTHSITTGLLYCSVAIPRNPKMLQNLASAPGLYSWDFMDGMTSRSVASWKDIVSGGALIVIFLILTTVFTFDW